MFFETIKFTTMLPNELETRALTPEAISASHGLVGIFADRQGAEQAYDAAINRGYSKEEINVVMSDKTHKEHFNDGGVVDTMLKEGAIGAGIGGTLGAIIGAVATIGTTILIPGIGIVAGPIMGALAGAGTFAVGGGVISGTLGLDDTEQRLDKNIVNINDGEILISFQPHNDEDANYLKGEWEKVANVRDVLRRK